MAPSERSGVSPLSVARTPNVAFGAKPDSTGWRPCEVSLALEVSALGSGEPEPRLVAPSNARPLTAADAGGIHTTGLKRKSTRHIFDMRYGQSQNEVSLDEGSSVGVGCALVAATISFEGPLRGGGGDGHGAAIGLARRVN